MVAPAHSPRNTFFTCSCSCNCAWEMCLALSPQEQPSDSRGCSVLLTLRQTNCPRAKIAHATAASKGCECFWLLVARLKARTVRSRVGGSLTAQTRLMTSPAACHDRISPVISSQTQVGLQDEEKGNRVHTGEKKKQVEKSNREYTWDSFGA